ncbi:MAG: DUF1232 domain-containing protein [Anaerolineae bacterium]|nr:DUF1232 domain-containing protein [Anaerolineae bacterium]
MSDQKPVPYDSTKSLAFLAGLIKRIRLVWNLFWDSRVPMWTKLVVPGSLLYLISPVDFVPDVVLGLGQLDDLSVILLGLALFVKLCPPEVVQAYLDRFEYGHLDDDEFVVETDYAEIAPDYPNQLEARNTDDDDGDGPTPQSMDED